MTTSDDNSILVQILDDTLALLTAYLNANLPGLIRAKGGDPIETVVEGEELLGEVSLGKLSAEATVKYQITDLTGLSSIHIDPITLDQPSLSLTNFTVGLSIPMHLEDKLQAKLGGQLYSSFGLLHSKLGIKGKSKITKLSVASNAVLKGRVNLLKKKVDHLQLEIADLDMDYGKIGFQITGFLGLFTFLLGPFTALLSRIFKFYITNTLSSLVQDALNQAIAEHIAEQSENALGQP